ncbi:PREDICTED: serine/arginine repetitive matrix protein 1-like isoform X1 [Amphimedon queenslandica]|uniref:RRM domain-containing protein n=1 Tax=Amphimedon queenslandica TaxID=400682 RepID=A0AAN0IM30_AMPQE|nr:PREDICTED: serine/arginine repetitive matrix protein 1-like isoform X1 [Amphimedon queenslandica]|eukprot:XP_011403847.2 PREDICTED: serine/arginine repetitive matrix protein 1-like isoform X1 [Amphimedon queenslandica]
MSVPRVIVRDLGNYGNKDELFRTYSRFGEIRNIWMATNPPGFAYVFFKNSKEAMKAVSSTNGSVICGERVRVEYLPTEDKKEFNSRLSNQSPIVRGRSPPPYSHRPMPPHPPRRSPPPSRPPPPHRSPVYRETGPPKYSHYPLSPPHRSRHKSPPPSHRRSPPPSLRGYESSSHSDYDMHGYPERGGHGNSYAHRDPYKREERITHYGDVRERREDLHHKRGRETSGYVVDRYVNKHSSERRLSSPPLPPPPPHRPSNYSHGHRDSGRRLGHYSLSPPPLPHNHTREHDLRHREQRRPPPPPIHSPRKSYQREAYQHVPSSEPRLRSSGPNRRHSDHRRQGMPPRQGMPARRKPKQIDLWTNPNQPRKRQQSRGGGRGRKGGGGRRRRDRSRSPHYHNANSNQLVDPNEIVFYETNDANDYVPEDSPPSLPPETEPQEPPIDSRDEERFSKEEYQGNDHSNIESPQTSSIANDFTEQDEEIEVDVEEGYQQDSEVFPLESQFLQLEELQGDSPQAEEQEQPVQNQFYGERKVNYSSKRSEREVICVADERQVRVSRSPSLQESRSRSGTPTLMD